jgi:hypothetical protein
MDPLSQIVGSVANSLLGNYTGPITCNAFACKGGAGTCNEFVPADCGNFTYDGFICNDDHCGAAFAGCTPDNYTMA